MIAPLRAEAIAEEQDTTARFSGVVLIAGEGDAVAVFDLLRGWHFQDLVSVEVVRPAQAARYRMAVRQCLLDLRQLTGADAGLDVPALDPVNLPALAACPGIDQCSAGRLALGAPEWA